VDPSSWNQTAYAGGSPFHLVDPSGMRTCVVYHLYHFIWYKDGTYTVEDWGYDHTECTGSGGGGGGGGDGSGDGSSDSSSKNDDPICAKLRALGLTGYDLVAMQLVFGTMNNGQATASGAFESGFYKDASGGFTYGDINKDNVTEIDGRLYYRTLSYPGLTIPKLMDGSGTPYGFHGHFVGWGSDRSHFNSEVASSADMNATMALPPSVNRFIGTPNQLFYINQNSVINPDGTSAGTKIGGLEWLKAKCY